MTKKILAVLLAFAMLFAFAACGGNSNKEDTTTTTEDPFASFGEEATEAATDATEAASDEATEAESDATEAASDDVSAESTEAASDATTEAAVKAPETKEEIVAYFNTAINNVKPNSKSITSNSMVHSVAGEVTGVPGIIDTVLGGTGNFISGFMGPDDSKANVTWTSAADKNAYFPVEGETWASKLTAADVQSAQIKEANGKYMIRITTVADGKSANVTHGSGHAPKAFNVVMPAVISENIPGAVASIFSIGTIEMNYPSSTVTVTVDAATGNVLTAVYELYWTINIPLGDTVVVLPFKTVNDYTINW